MQFANNSYINGTFTKGPFNDELVRIQCQHDKLTITQTTAQQSVMSELMDVMDKCNSTRINAVESNSQHDDEKFVDCIARNMTAKVESIRESMTYLDKSRNRISQRLRNYTCADHSLASTPSLRRYDMYVPSLRDWIPIDVLLDTPNAKIWTIDEFISEEECQQLMRVAWPNLLRATIAAPNGSNVVSPHRRAQQARYTLQQENDPLR